MERRKKLRMGETLVSQGLITLDQLRIGLKEQKTTGLPIGRQLVALGFITEAVLRDQLANALGSQGVDLRQVVRQTIDGAERLVKEISGTAAR